MSSVLVAWYIESVGAWIPTFLLVLFTTLLVLNVFGGRPKNFPPGMMILPVIGSLLSMPFGPSNEVVRGLRKKYGNIASFAIFGTRMVVVSGTRLMKEVFAHQSTLGRPEMLFMTFRNYMITNFRTSEIGIIATSGQEWQEQHRFLTHHLRNLGFGKSSFESVIIEEITAMMDRLAKEESRPVQMRYQFNRSMVNILWGIVMERRYPEGHAKFDKLMETSFQPGDFNFFSPVFHIPHIFKFMNYIPTHRKGHTCIKNVHSFLKEELEEFLANEELRNGNNFTALYLKEIEKKENPNFNMDHLEAMINDMFLAGIEITSSSLSTAINLVIKHPHVQRRLQEELDEVLGNDRLPSVFDMKQLPYVQATIHESQRMFNISKFSLPHKTIEDYKLGGYDIPKGTWLLPNLDDAHRNSEYWKNALEFEPQNFLDENGKFKKNDAFMPYGVGKRICPGIDLARMQLFLFFTHLFQRFTITLVEEQKPLSRTNPSFCSPSEYTAILKCRSK